MADSRQRTTEEREAARRERANRRALREGRPVPYAEPPAAEPSPPAGTVPEPTPDPVPEPTPDPVPEPTPDPVPEPTPDPVPEPIPDPVPAPVPDPVPAPLPDSAPASRIEPPPEAGPRAPDPPSADLLPEPEPLIAPPPSSSVRPIKSFPSPPDPEFYVPDDELEVPAGTRRVSRGARPARGGRPPRSPRRGPQGEARRPRRWLGRIAALIALLVAAAVIYVAIETFQPFGTSPHGHVTVHIRPHTSAADVARLLQSRGVIASRRFFELRTALDGDRDKIRAGTYRLQKSMSYGAVLKRLTTAPPKARTSQLTITEGHTRQYVAALLRKQHVPGSYLAATRHSPLLNPRHLGAPRSTHTLEGFLFPDTYQLVDPIRMHALVADQLKDFKRRFATLNLSAARRDHLTPFDVVTIASLIQGEAGRASDDAKVASVILNRLRDHMMLQLDSTTRYATGNLTRPLTVSQLNSRSPYNTRNHYGLPPGPIDSPGLTALRAAAHPAHTHDLYFFTKPCTNQAVFATSYAEFNTLLIRDKRTHCPK
jgi:UPF0755 protein